MPPRLPGCGQLGLRARNPIAVKGDREVRVSSKGVFKSNTVFFLALCSYLYPAVGFLAKHSLRNKRKQYPF